MLEREKIFEHYKGLKEYFISNKIPSREARETMYRMIEFLDNNYPADANVLLLAPQNGNKNMKVKNSNDYKVKALPFLKVKN
jgi:hypothetical protein